MYIDREERPSVISPATCAVAILLHLSFFGIMYWMGRLDFSEKLTVIPIELSVVLHENLNGVENEPPPDKPLESEPQKPDPPPPEPEKIEPAKPDPPKIKAEDVVVAEKEPQKRPEKAKEPEKPKDPPKPRLTREERMRQMLESATDVKVPKTPPPPKNGKTGPKTLSDAEIARLMKLGVRAGSTESLAPNDTVLFLSLIKQAFYDQWRDRPPWNAGLRDAVLAVSLAADGRVTGYRITQSSGDRRADDSVLRAAAAVRRIPGLSHAFWVNNKTVNVQFHVTPSL